MRNLTIMRTKSFVGCIAKIKIYIEDPTSREIIISGTPCKKIGELKNGEQKVFSIDESALKVFVIVDKLLKSFCNDFYQIPEGQQDVFISGKNKFNPIIGNAFIFDDNQNRSAFENRKKVKQKGIIVFSFAILIGLIFGFALAKPLFENAPESKQFSKEGITITLTDEFRDTEIGNYTVCYDSSKVAVFALKEDFSLIPGLENYTLSQYAELVFANNKIEADLKYEDGLTYFYYEKNNEAENNIYSYRSYLFKTDNSFWIVQFATLKNNSNEQIPNITKWVKSISFNN